MDIERPKGTTSPMMRHLKVKHPGIPAFSTQRNTSPGRHVARKKGMYTHHYRDFMTVKQGDNVFGSIHVFIFVYVCTPKPPCFNIYT